MFRKIKKAILQNPIVLAAPLHTRLENRPISVTLLSPQGFALDTVQKIALGLLIVPTGLGFVASLFSAQWTLFFITGFILLLMGLVVWVIKLRSEMIWKVTWHRDFVEVEDGRYGQPVFWIEPLSAFSGLVRDFGLIPRVGKYSTGRRVYGLLLTHPEAFKSVLLYADYESIGDGIVAYYEEQLGQKLIETGAF